MAGDGRVARGAHDVADGAMGARTAGGSGYVAVSGDTPVRNASDDRADSAGKIGRSHHLQSLLKTPVVTAIAVISVAPGIGANVAIFSMFNHMLLRPLPVRIDGCCGGGAASARVRVSRTTRASRRRRAILPP